MEIVKINHKNLDSLNLKKLGTILSMKQEIKKRKTLTIAAIYKHWELWKKD